MVSGKLSYKAASFKRRGKNREKETIVLEKVAIVRVILQPNVCVLLKDWMFQFSEARWPPAVLLAPSQRNFASNLGTSLYTTRTDLLRLTSVSLKT